MPLVLPSVPWPLIVRSEAKVVVPLVIVIWLLLLAPASTICPGPLTVGLPVSDSVAKLPPPASVSVRPVAITRLESAVSDRASGIV